MEEHLQQLPQSGRKKRAPGTRIGAAAGAAVLIAIFFGISSQKKVKAANLFLPLKGEGRPGTIAKFANSADLVHIQQRAFKLVRLLYYCLSISRRIFMPIRILRCLPAAAFAALLVILAFIAPTPIAAAGSTWVDNGATACEKYLTPDVVATILRNPGGKPQRLDAHSCHVGPIYIALTVADIDVFRLEVPRIVGAHPISGFGDDAYWNGAGAFSAVKGHGRGCDISVIDPGAPKIHNAELGQKLGAICNKLFAIP